MDTNSAFKIYLVLHPFFQNIQQNFTPIIHLKIQNMEICH